ncbi:MAG: hypothetical protein OHK93_003803 [Ramalina farinacea]|uniref:Spherulin-4 n=1 Tax=Ramalina farinacea TaxID=258253 RepID=A0AA43QHU1_9LECA|nr:hypothetical protein [Ramalina farinacea]
MKSLQILSLCSLALPTTSLFVLLPLYVYPGPSASAWNNVTTAIAAYPTVQWQIIINPNSGPDTTSYPTDSNFITGISNLNKYPNVITLGYVRTTYAQRPYANVTSDIDVYAYWASYSGANISIGGIFFDEVTGEDNTPASIQTYYENLSAYAYDKVPSTVTPVVFNPGSPGLPALFDSCDTMVEFESPLSSYGGLKTIQALPAGYADQSSLIIYNATAATNVKSLVHTMSVNGVGSTFFDYGVCFYQGQPTGCYNTFSLTNLKLLAAAVQAG